MHPKGSSSKCDINPYGGERKHDTCSSWIISVTNIRLIEIKEILNITSKNVFVSVQRRVCVCVCVCM